MAEPAPTSPVQQRHGMPVGIHNAYLFQVFNTFSWQISQALPIILFFKYLGASDTILGIAAALNPLMNMLQIPAASHVERTGYRRFALRGWTLRTVFIGAIACIPLLHYRLDSTTCLVLTLFCLFGYSTLRGISLCAFLPWMTLIIDEKVRGHFLSRDQMYSTLAGLLTMLGIALLFSRGESNLVFSIAFSFSLIAALISLHFLKQMPDAPPPVKIASSTEEVPWKAMLFHPPFLKLMIFNVVYNSSIAAAGVFWVPNLRDNFQWGNSDILYLGAASTLAAICALWYFGRTLDRVGSKPVLDFGCLLTLIHFGVWFCLSAKIVPFNVVTYTLLAITAGLGGPVFNLANARLAMSTVPEMGRSHFFALFSVINSLTLGILPILWGIALDTCRGFHFRWGLMDLNNYSAMYIALIITVFIALLMRRRLDEARAMSSDQFFRELLVDTPARAISRLLNRRNFP
jgi:hypothetical protein